MKLENKIALITGGAGGLGLATARRFLQEGANVVIVGRNEQNLINAIESTDETFRSRLSYFVADVKRPDDCAAYAAHVMTRYGRIDVFFNNAGMVGQPTPLTEYSLEGFQEVMETNVTGVWLGLKYVLPIMRMQKDGNVIITSSMAGIKASPNLGAYVTSKHALVGLMKMAALENVSFGIRVNSIHPGTIDNSMMRRMEQGLSPASPEFAKGEFEKTIPMGRYGTNEEVASLVLFLASAESSYVTGCTYLLDGGMSLL